MEWQQAEEVVRQYLQKWFGQTFSKKRLQVGTVGQPLEHEFDAVSSDGEVVAEVKRYLQPETQKMKNVIEDVSWLYLATAKKKFIFLTDPVFYVAFCRANQDDLLIWKKAGIEFISPFEVVNY